MIPLALACGATPPEAAPPAVPAPVATADAPVIPGPDLVGLCDASAAVLIGRYLVVADDERNTLFVFDWSKDAAPAGAIDLAPLSASFEGDEADLEGMAAMPDGTVWVTGSHDRGKGTEPKPARQRLFALKLAATDAGVQATLAAGPTDRLIAEGGQTHALADVLVTTEGKTSKDPGGLSIEGLAAGPAGSLLIGFRAPVHAGKALVARLEDPGAFVAGGPPRVVGPRWVALGGRGIRDLAADGDGWRIVAGPPSDGGDFALYRWTGFDDGSAPVRLPFTFEDLTPEALVKIGAGWWVLSDDGRREIGGTACKDLPAAERRARTARIPE